MTKERADGPFFHGTKAELPSGEAMPGGNPSNYRPDIIMNHIEIMVPVDGVVLAADVAA